MKRVLFLGAMLLALCMSFSFTSSAAKKHVDVTITTTRGCKVHIVGDVTYSLFPPSIDGFSGTVTIGPPCPSQTLTFAMTASGGGGGDAEVTLDNADPCRLAMVSWSSGDPETDDILNSAEVNEALVFELSQVCEQ